MWQVFLAGRIGEEQMLQFIQDRVKAGEWWTVTGDINAVTNTIEYIPASGKTAVLFEAKIVITGHTTPVNSTGESFNQVEADLKIDSTVVDTTNIGWGARGTTSGAPTQYPAFGTIGDGRFNCLGISLAGNGTKKIEIENIVDNGTASATMSGWLYTT